MFSFKRRKTFCIAIILALFSTLPASPKNKKMPQPEPKDSIEIIGHLTLAQGPAVNLLTGVHWRRNYLYIEHGSQGAVTVVDVTDPRPPKNIGEFVPPPGSTSLHVSAVEGQAAMFTGAPSAPHSQSPESVTILSFDDPAQPIIVREFSHVTCLLKDTTHGLIYLTNDEGLWVLHPNPAPDRELEEEYDHYIRYSH